MAANNRKNTEHEELRDHNREVKLLAISMLQDLIRQAVDPTFSGRISVEVNSIRGKLSSPAETRVRFRSKN